MTIGQQPGMGQTERVDHLRQMEELFDFYGSGKEQVEAALAHDLSKVGMTLTQIRNILIPGSVFSLAVKNDLLTGIKMWNHGYRTQLTSSSKDVRDLQAKLQSNYINSIQRIIG